MTARLAAAPAATCGGRGSSALRSPKRRCRGSAVRRRSAGSPSPNSRASKPNNQRLQVTIERGSPRPPRARIRPAPPDQLTVPAQQRRRAHRKTRPGASRQRPRKRREDRSIDGTDPHSSGRPAQDRQLVPEHQDLELLRPFRSAQQQDELNQAAERHIDKRPNHAHLRNRGRAKLSIYVLTPTLRPRAEFLNPTRSSAKLFRYGAYPPLRGTLLSLRSRSAVSGRRRRHNAGKSALGRRSGIESAAADPSLLRTPDATVSRR
jgi:hypothetical protein